MDISTFLFFAAGLAFLIVGAELLVRGASGLASAIGISPLVVGLTVVAFGTSSPEIAVSVQSALSGQGDVALGNAVGSNIFNILFVLGLSALVAPLLVSRQLVRWDVPLMIVASLLLMLLGLDGTLGRFDGILLFAGLVAYLAWSIRIGRREAGSGGGRHRTELPRAGKSGKSIILQVVFVIAGLALLVVGSRWLVTGAVAIAHALGVSDLIIALTIIAAGTSLPEVATSVLASIRGERDIAVGNVVGSNLFNILCVLGLAAMVAPAGIPVHPAALRFDIPVMIAVSIACLPIFFHESRISRWEGGLFFGYYLAYTGYLILDAAGHDYLPAYSDIMMEFVIPLTIVTLAIVVFRYLRSQRQFPTVS